MKKLKEPGIDQVKIKLDSEKGKNDSVGVRINGLVSYWL